jgi:hypothetical protein
MILMLYIRSIIVGCVQFVYKLAAVLRGTPRLNAVYHNKLVVVATSVVPCRTVPNSAISGHGATDCYLQLLCHAELSEIPQYLAMVQRIATCSYCVMQNCPKFRNIWPWCNGLLPAVTVPCRTVPNSAISGHGATDCYLQLLCNSRNQLLLLRCFSSAYGSVSLLYLLEQREELEARPTEILTAFPLRL